VSVAQRRDDPRRLLLEGYDYHKPATRADALLVKALTPLERIGLPMVRPRDGGEHRFVMGGQLAVTVAWIEDC
jgi:hypothetical protein